MNPNFTNFSGALEALNNGLCVARNAMPDGSFIFRQVPSKIETTFIPKMTSLPESAKAEFIRRDSPLRYDHQFALVDSNNNICGWTPLPADIGAEDWLVLNMEGPR